MKRVHGLGRLFALALVAFSLYSVVPSTPYNPRLELFDPTAIPTAVEGQIEKVQERVATSAYTQPTSPINSESTKSLQTSAHAAIPYYRPPPVAEATESHSYSKRPDTYQSLSTSRESVRGPPFIS
jgi:hypothetical protein